MPRIRQQYPGNYKTSGNISSEFENLYRYLSSAEFGDRTLSEILDGFVDANGNFVGPVQFRLEPTLGLQFRVGTYTDDSLGWTTIATAASIRGADGTAVGDITQSPIGDPVLATSTASQVNFDFAHDATDNVLVYRSGLLLREGGSNDYTRNATGGTSGTGVIIFNTAQTAGQNYAFIRVRANSATTFIRQDTVTTSTQSVFAYDTRLIGQTIWVYRNGILQREGGTNDFTRLSNVVTFNTGIATGNTVTVIGFTAAASTSVPGLMRAASYVDSTTGLIRLDRIGIGSGAIANDRVNGLAALMSAAARLSIGPTAPVDPSITRFWIDTSTAPSVLKAWDGSVWLATSVASIIPTFTAAQANQFLRVNGTGTAAIWSTVDLSSVIPRTWQGAANGVASLDSTGRLPSTQLPAAIPYQTIYYAPTGTITGGTYVMQRIYGQRIRITGFRGSLTGGTCTAQITVSGLGVGASYTLSASPVENALGTAIEVDATSASRAIGISITSPASATGLEIALACQLVL